MAPSNCFVCGALYDVHELLAVVCLFDQVLCSLGIGKAENGLLRGVDVELFRIMEIGLQYSQLAADFCQEGFPSGFVESGIVTDFCTAYEVVEVGDVFGCVAG